MASTENLVPMAERRAAEAAAKAKITETQAAALAEARRALGAANDLAARALSDLETASRQADAEAMARATRALTSQCNPLVSELLATESLEVAASLRGKYRALQRGMISLVGREFTLAPVALVGQSLITKNPALKPRIARLECFWGVGLNPSIENNAVHSAMMADEIVDHRGIRDAVFALETKLLEIGRANVAGSRFGDAIWEAVRSGASPAEIHDLESRLAAEWQRNQPVPEWPTSPVNVSFFG
jgi:multidrug efflux pump subunit AcrA (membrane-fusion protein)